MRHVRFHEHGGPDVLRIEDAPVPRPGSGEVLIRVRSAGVTPPLLAQLRGAAQVPACPGGDIAGEVVELGADVRGFEVGELVAGLVMSGAFAEYASVPAFLLSTVPDGLGAAEAMVVARGGLVALGVLRAARLSPSESALVTAAAGGVGHLAVQLARVLGASRVVAAVGSPDKKDLVAELGADEVVCYDEDWGAPVDVVADGVGGDVLRSGVDALAPFGRLVSFSAPGGQIEVNSLRAEVRSVIGFAMGRLAGARPELVERMRGELWSAVAGGRLRPVVHEEFPLADAAEAVRVVAERRNLGKVAIRP
ncbi:quinone oxidoreductase family protein [Saccharopolyspora taberi]|uniref:Zinc-binding dehydrogenase n=1 Tax=Saccharopolyspora taberi TaxID=60895 RepID=A0ABN3V479_9PSEU